MRHFSLLLTLLLAGCAAQLPYNSVSYYICAHPDDCVLFLNPPLARDAADPSRKVVSIYLTAGDAGLAMEAERGKTEPYFAAREKALVVAMQYLTGEDVSQAELPETELVAGKPVTVYAWENTKTYFLRLPDGLYYGQGAPKTGYHSLSKLFQGEHGMLTIDGSAQYDSWDELKAVLEAIIKQEAKASRHVTINTQEPDTDVNPDDHSDHTLAGTAVLEIAAQYPCITVGKFEDYVTRLQPRNVEGEELQRAVGAFEALSATLKQYNYPDAWDAEHRASLGHNYFTLKNSSGDCHF